MLLALNYSPQATQLIAEGAIEVDRLKCPDWPEQIADAAASRPVYVHFPLEADRITDQRVTDAIRLADATDTPFINLHLSPRQSAYSDDDAVRSAVRLGVEQACRIAGADRVIVENVPLGNPAEGFASAANDPAFIAELVRDAGCGLLLDLSHARLTADHWRADWRAHVLALPVEQLAELHLTGIATVDGRAMDHMPFGDDDWTAAEWAMSEIAQGHWPAPRIVAVEYGGVGPPFAWRSEAGVIARDMPRIGAMVRDAAAARRSR